MIIVKLMGGHSNQIFQYAAARQLALKKKTSLKLDLSWFDAISENDTTRVYELDAYNIQEDIYTPTLLLRLLHKIGYIKYYHEPSFRYSDTIEQLGPNTHLEGYFQSWKYFKDIRKIIQGDFSYRKEPSPESAVLLKKIHDDPYSVSMHIRRGDYVSNPHANNFHGLKDIKYYKAALKELQKTIKHPNIYVISNDPEWCRDNLKLGVPTVIVDANMGDKSGAEDMRLMRACKHNILANSSFSWWGAWLNENPNKIVVAPKKWFNDESIDTSDLIPESWVRL